MPVLIGAGNRSGTVTTDAFAIPNAWIDRWVTISFSTRPVDIRNASKSYTLRGEVAPTSTGPWQEYGGFDWASDGTNMVGKFGAVNTPSSYSVLLPASLTGWFVRAVCEIPETMRVRIDVELQ